MVGGFVSNRPFKNMDESRRTPEIVRRVIKKPQEIPQLNFRSTRYDYNWEYRPHQDSDYKLPRRPSGTLVDEISRHESNALRRARGIPLLPEINPVAPGVHVGAVVRAPSVERYVADPLDVLVVLFVLVVLIVLIACHFFYFDGCANRCLTMFSFS